MKKQNRRRTSSKKLQAIQTSRHLHVSHRKHTGRVLPRRSTSYPMLAMIVLCVGVFLGSWTRFVFADTYPDPQQGGYAVMTSVPGPAPTQAPTIAVPSDTATVTTSPITVSGSCAVSTYEVLYRNGVFSGVAICDAAGHYELQTTLFIGNNQLQTRVFSSTDVPGPFSNSVTVRYALSGGGSTSPTTTQNSASSGKTASGTTTTTSPPSAAAVANPLIFKTNFKYTGHYTGQSASWDVSLEGGTEPYAVSVDWGDGTRSLLSRQRAGNINVDHTYKKPGGYKGSYVVVFSASDADGNQTSLQLLTIVNNPPAALGAGKTGGQQGGFGSTAPNELKALIQYIWPSYGVVVLMLLSFWLGERREFHILKPQLRKTRHA